MEDNARFSLIWNIPDSGACADKCEEDDRCEGWTYYTEDYWHVNFRHVCDLYPKLMLEDFPVFEPTVISGPCNPSGMCHCKCTICLFSDFRFGLKLECTRSLETEPESGSNLITVKIWHRSKRKFKSYPNLGVVAELCATMMSFLVTCQLIDPSKFLRNRPIRVLKFKEEFLSSM